MGEVMQSEAILAGVVGDLAVLPGKLRTGAAFAQDITVTLDMRAALRLARLIEGGGARRISAPVVLVFSDHADTLRLMWRGVAAAMLICAIALVRP